MACTTFDCANPATHLVTCAGEGWHPYCDECTDVLVRCGKEQAKPIADEQTVAWDFPGDLLEAAWGIIANAHGGHWGEATGEWREAAERWRDAYHEASATQNRAAPRAMSEREQKQPVVVTLYYHGPKKYVALDAVVEALRERVEMTNDVDAMIVKADANFIEREFGGQR